MSFVKNDWRKKTPRKKKIILTVRATDDADIDLLNELKEVTNSKTHTGAIMSAARQLPALYRRVAALEKQITNLEKIKKTQADVLSIQYHAARQLESYGKKIFNGEKFPEPELEI